MACGVKVSGHYCQVLRATGWARMVSCATRPGSRSDLEGCCGEADRVVVVRPTSPVSGPPGRKRCPASVGSGGCRRERAGDGCRGRDRPPGAGPLAVDGYDRVRAGRDHRLGVGSAAAGHQGGPGYRDGHDRAAPGGGDRRGHPRVARVDPGPALAGQPPVPGGSAPAHRRRDGRDGPGAHAGLGSAGRGRLRDHRAGDRHSRRADQRGGLRRRAGRGAHPHADDARRLVHRGRGRGGDRRGLRGAGRLSGRAVHR